MDNTDTLVEAGLAFTCDFAKDIPFLGQDTVEAQKVCHGGMNRLNCLFHVGTSHCCFRFVCCAQADGIPSKRLLQILVEDPQPLMYHGEVVLYNGKVRS